MIIQDMIQRQAKLILVSDGLFHPTFEIRSSVWVIISSINTSNIIFVDNIILGKNGIYYSHRSELGGIIGGSYHIITLCNKYQIDKVKTIASCDGQETIDKANRVHLKPTMSISDFNLISTLYHIIHLMLEEVCFSYIKGHHNKQVNSLSIIEELNVIADIRAKVALYEFIVSVGNISKLQSNRAIIGGIKVNAKFLPSNILSNLKKELPRMLAKERTMNFWVHYGKQFMINDNADLKTFYLTTQNILSYLSF